MHGDLGRTVPNVASIINCQADILQLDVTWLFDDFEGGGEDVSGGDYIDSSVYSGLVPVAATQSSAQSTPLKKAKRDGDTRSWKSMRVLNLTSFNSTR